MYVQESDLQRRCRGRGLALSSLKEKREKQGATLCLILCFGTFAGEMFHPFLYFLFSLFKPVIKLSQIKQCWGISEKGFVRLMLNYEIHPSWRFGVRGIAMLTASIFIWTSAV